ncbi:microsomal glutathione S-transferase 1-like [Ostrinia nubilalis]|uniref:microsomal glutathione S-transferase 1-like n=1 Tax=Ostrinia nubilalis TaxID=29057 RepID=UPI0030826728
MASISLDNPAVQSYLFYSGVLSLKMLGMSSLTARQRFAKKVFANEEDASSAKGVVKFDDPDVERVRRAHLNDLENIPVFFAVGALYLTTAPDNDLAVNLFRAYAAGRILHTVVYAIKPLPQPARAIAFSVPCFITILMGVKVVMHYAKAF